MLKATTDILLRSTLPKNVAFRLLTAAADVKHEEKLQTFRTQESDPTKHTTDHLAQFYTLPPEDKKVIFLHGGFPKTFETHIKTFNETCFMVREPSIEVINYLKSIDYNKPAVRFVLYGKVGNGKSLSLAHILHYAYKNNFLIVHVPWASNWMNRPKDVTMSETKGGFVDLNIDAAAWLLHFKTQNAEFLRNPNLKISRTIEWTKRETTPEATSLMELVDHGINRIRFASSCVTILAEEIKLLCSSGVCKALVAIDGFNAMFYSKTRVLTEKKEIVPPSRITLNEGFLNLSKFDWKNGAVVVTVDQMVGAQGEHTSHFPRSLLGKTGFIHMDPFIPIEVKNFSRKEHQSIMEYFKERQWVQDYPGLDDELYFLSGGNPYKLLEYCRSL
ncbi:small ribosomal subunit protein mS29 [Euwallacea similis]|uniref:small ribosomal subunit protein mS29 n=1 Tax=Euwallacea similis TaxID=1736056 RepID=UPI00344EE872